MTEISNLPDMKFRMARHSCRSGSGVGPDSSDSTRVISLELMCWISSFEKDSSSFRRLGSIKGEGDRPVFETTLRKFSGD